MSKHEAKTREIPRLYRMAGGIKRTMWMFPDTKVIAWCNVEINKLKQQAAQIERYFKIESSLD